MAERRLKRNLLRIGYNFSGIIKSPKIYIHFKTKFAEIEQQINGHTQIKKKVVQ